MKVAVNEEEWSAGQLAAIRATAGLFGIRICEYKGTQSEEYCGLISFRGAAWHEALSSPGLLKLLFSPCDEGPPKPERVEFAFSNVPILPAPLRNKRITEFGIAVESLDSSGDEGQILARVGDDPVWMLRNAAVCSEWCVATSAPSLAGKCTLAEIFNGDVLLNLLPLWCYLKTVAGGHDWEAPSLRACLIVDDPNLHRVTYGQIDYPRLVERGRDWGFHSAMATIPMDHWRVSRRAAQLFNDNRDVLSLQVHGNYHRRQELAQYPKAADRLKLAYQSLVNTERYEQKLDFAIDRVMVPPHGVCTPAMFETLGRFPFEALTTSRWAYWNHNLPSDQAVDSFMRPALLADHFFPVVSRYRFKSPVQANECVIAALLGQPIVPYGHHQDFSNDMIDVRAAVDSINALGDVQWMNMSQILQSNFEHRAVGNELHVRPYARQIEIQIPEHVTSLIIHAPPNEQAGSLEVHISNRDEEGHPRKRVDIGETTEWSRAKKLSVIIRDPHVQPGPHRLKRRRIPPLGLFARRLLVEARDRFLSP